MRLLMIASLIAIAVILAVTLATLCYPIAFSHWHSRGPSRSDAAMPLYHRVTSLESSPPLFELSMSLLMTMGGILFLYRPDLFIADIPRPSRQRKDDQT